MQVGNVPIESALKLTKLAYPFRDILFEDFFDVLEILAIRKLILFNEEKTEYKKIMLSLQQNIISRIYLQFQIF